jgi:hypothetical protein
MEAFEPYTAALAFSAALLLVAARLAKKQLVWKRKKPVPARRRPDFSRFMALVPLGRKFVGGKSHSRCT